MRMRGGCEKILSRILEFENFRYMNFWEFETMLLASNHTRYGGEEYEEAFLIYFLMFRKRNIAFSFIKSKLCIIFVPNN